MPEVNTKCAVVHSEIKSVFRELQTLLGSTKCLCAPCLYKVYPMCGVLKGCQSAPRVCESVPKVRLGHKACMCKVVHKLGACTRTFCVENLHENLEAAAIQVELKLNEL